MAGINVRHTIGDLHRDLRTIRAQAPKDMRTTVLAGIRAGNEVAKGYARTNNGPNSHSRKYPGTFSAEMHGGAFGKGSLFGNVISGEYGPRHAGQGMLAPILEDGVPGRNAPQNNLRRSADLVSAIFPREVRALPDRWFWPGGDR